ncbi:MAG TPA: AAA family ATPase [Thermoguttaceae bacterium]|nr:AAA family ATPase [Thermoguttaceae bacterium]
MRIKALKVDGYGVWTRLKLDELGEGIHVFHGPNEAGKTTLMQFLRAMFFGFSPDRRRYLPPVHGGRPGGTIDLATPDGSFVLSRHDDDEAPGPHGTAVLAAPDGTRHGESYVHSLLSGTDEATFNNVFCVGLREIQELGTLDSTEAASLLFSLTAGLDRVSLVDVLRELAASRRRLLADDGRSGQIFDLLARRDELRRTLNELDTLTSQYGQLVSQSAVLDRDAQRLDQSRAQLEHAARVLESAASLRDRWTRRGQIDSQLAALHVSTTGLEDAFGQFEQVDRRLRRFRQRAARVDRARRATRRRAAAVEINEPLHRQAARIEAFREQEGWITSLRAKVADLENESREVNRELADQRSRLGLDDAGSSKLPEKLHRKHSAELRRIGRELRRRRETMAEAQTRFDQCNEAARSRDVQIQNALASRGIGNLNDAIAAAGSLVAGLRRRVQLDDRIRQLERHQVELDQQGRDLLGRQILSMPLVVGLGAVFVFSVIMIIAGVCMSSSLIGALRWPLLILGIGSVLTTLGMKIMLERSNSRKLDTCQQQIHSLQQQIAQAKQEHDQLDRSLPPIGSRGSQLDVAENDLAELEEMTPHEARRQAAQQEVDAAKLHLQTAEEDLRDAKRRWTEALDLAGLPKGVSPKQVRGLLTHRRQWTALARRADQTASELQQRQAELDAVTDRVTQLATEAGVAVASGNPIEVLHLLSESLRQEQTKLAQRKELSLKARRQRRVRAKLEAKIRPLRLRRRRCLARLGARDGDELQRKRQMLDQAAQLQHDRLALQAEIETALVGQCSETELAACMAEATDDDVETRWDAIDRQLQTVRSQLNECLERRGQIKAQLTELAGDRRGARARLQLGTLQKRLAATVRRWQVLALTEKTLTAVKHFYETERQPETLQEASEYLRRLTGGRYGRVWTPLGEDVLRVDDAHGGTLPVEVLSEGTREQLFLALRLALVACYGRRGVRLPLILDDVLVNFDTPRAKAAADVLRDFAHRGHQLLVFTCHDHIVSLFKSLDVDVRRLPSHRETAAGVETSAPSRHSSRRPKKSHKRRLKKEGKRAVDFRLEDEISAWQDETEDRVADDDQIAPEEDASGRPHSKGSPSSNAQRESDSPVDLDEVQDAREDDLDDAAA